MADEAGAVTRTGLAAERTWLAWWRTALAATAGALGIGRLAPELLNVPSWPYAVLGAGYAFLAIALLAVGALRQRSLQRAIDQGEQAPLPFAMVAVFTLGGAFLTIMTLVLVIAQT